MWGACRAKKGWCLRRKSKPTLMPRAGENLDTETRTGGLGAQADRRAGGPQGECLGTRQRGLTLPLAPRGRLHSPRCPFLHLCACPISRFLKHPFPTPTPRCQDRVTCLLITFALSLWFIRRQRKWAAFNVAPSLTRPNPRFQAPLPPLPLAFAIFPTYSAKTSLTPLGRLDCPFACVPSPLAL